jgi:hypothetical protein
MRLSALAEGFAERSNTPRNERIGRRQMEEFLSTPGPIAIAYAAMIVALTKILADNRTKRKLLEARVSDETVRALYARRDPDAWGALRWGMVLAGVGFAFVLIDLGGFGATDPIAYGLIFLFAGGGLMGYHLIVRATGRRFADPPPARETAEGPRDDA